MLFINRFWFNMSQISLQFEAGLVERFPTLMDCVRASVYGCGKPAKVIAMDLDMTPSEFSRKLSPNPSDNVNFPLHLLDELMASTGCLMPLHWLSERRCERPDMKRERLMADLQAQMRRTASVLAALEA